MKRLILILLCLPLFVFSQEERTYGKTMSISQFVRELEDAGNAFKVSLSSSTCQAYKSSLELFIEFAKTTSYYTNAELDQFQ